MTETVGSEAASRGWPPGVSGNPNGRPRGARNKATIAVEQLLDGEAEIITRKAIDLAKVGDMTAIRLCMDRLCPPRKDRPVMFALPPLQKAEDAAKGVAAIAAAVASGDLTPMEAAELSRVLDTFTRTVEATEFEARLAKLESANK